MHWLNPLKLEAKVSKILFEMEQTAWKLDLPKLESHILYLTSEIDRLDHKVTSNVPPHLVLPYDKPIMNPFKKDNTYKDTVKKWYGGEVDAVSGGFTRVKFEPLNLGSASQVKDFLYSEGWIPTTWNYKKSKGGGFERDVHNQLIKTSPKLTEDSYDSISGDLGKDIALRLKCAHRRSQLEGWRDRVRDDGRLSQGISGMTPTARATHVGIVNVPGSKSFFGKEMREVFIVKEEYKLVGCDAAGCQLRFLAHYMGDQQYIDDILATDPHNVTSMLTGLSRDESKTFIYALLFGAGIPKLAGQLGKTRRQTEAIKNLFLNKLPQLEALLKDLEKQTRRGYLDGLDGRKIYCDSNHKALNYLVQSGEGILMRTALCFLDNAIKKGGYDAKLVGWIHDEFQLEVKEEHAIAVGEISREAIEKAGRYLKVIIPMTGDPKIGNSWADTH